MVNLAMLRRPKRLLESARWIMHQIIGGITQMLEENGFIAETEKKYPTKNKKSGPPRRYPAFLETP